MLHVAMYRVDQRVFIVRLWKEIRAPGRSRPAWRGSVTNVATQQTVEFSGPRGLVRFLSRAAAALEHPRR
ncbi:MAG: hypothetical protein QN178_14690 [Armatimonadota bacterium]|nr:hypothetical protein [Armatimonadota bacterium]